MEEHKSLMREMYHDNNKILYYSVDFESAKKNKDAVVIFEGDYGGIIYLTCPIEYVKCTEEELRMLLKEIDRLYWNDVDGTNISYERMNDKFVVGGMTGGQVMDGLWIHPKIQNLPIEEKIKKIILKK